MCALWHPSQRQFFLLHSVSSIIIFKLFVFLFYESVFLLELELRTIDWILSRGVLFEGEGLSKRIIFVLKVKTATENFPFEFLGSSIFCIRLDVYQQYMYMLGAGLGDKFPSVLRKCV